MIRYVQKEGLQKKTPKVPLSLATSNTVAIGTVVSNRERANTERVPKLAEKSRDVSDCLERNLESGAG